MKHFLFTFMSFFLFTVAAQAQHVNVGIKGGLNAYNIKVDDNTDYNTKYSFHAGLLGHIHLSRQIALQPEVVYSIQGTKTTIGNTDLSLNLNYINIPVLFQYMFDNGFRIEAGPQLGILTRANTKTGDIDVDVKSSFTSTDIGIVLGLSYVKPATGFGFDIRYNHGLTNINENDPLTSYNRGFQAGIFYLFGHKS